MDTGRLGGWGRGKIALKVFTCSYLKSSYLSADFSAGVLPIPRPDQVVAPAKLPETLRGSHTAMPRFSILHFRGRIGERTSTLPARCADEHCWMSRYL
jgi:hypothetical protein